jgi:hypothetical protein
LLRKILKRLRKVEMAGGPADYVLAALDDAAQSPEWKARQAAEQQLSLF